jgi:hypothetical protein
MLTWRMHGHYDADIMLETLGHVMSVGSWLPFVVVCRRMESMSLQRILAKTCMSSSVRMDGNYSRVGRWRNGS